MLKEKIFTATVKFFFFQEAHSCFESFIKKPLFFIDETLKIK